MVGAQNAGVRPRLSVLDFGLRNRTGHHYNLALALAAGADASGVEIDILAGDTFTEAGPLEGRVSPFFSTDLYLRYRSSVETENYESWLVVNDRLLGDFDRLSPERLARIDLLLIPAVTAFHVWALCRWLRDVVLPQTQATVFVQLMFSPDWSSWGRPSPTGAQMYAEAFELIRDAVGRRVFLSAELPASAREYTALLRMPVEVLAHPSLQGDPLAGEARAADRPAVVGVFGYSKREKGFHLLPAVVEAVRTADQAHFVIQVDHGGEEPEVAAAVQALQTRAGPALDLVRGALDADAYQAMLARADLILLPYDPDLYRSRGSGVLAEAVSLGKPVVAPAGSGIGEEISAGRAAGVLFRSFDAPAVAAAIGQALAGLETLTDQAETIAEARREQHSGRGYVDQLRAWAGR